MVLQCTVAKTVSFVVKPNRIHVANITSERKYWSEHGFYAMQPVLVFAMDFHVLIVME